MATQVYLNCEIFAISLPSQLFLGCHLGFHIFFSLGAAHFFYSYAVWIKMELLHYQTTYMYDKFHTEFTFIWKLIIIFVDQ